MEPAAGGCGGGGLPPRLHHRRHGSGSAEAADEAIGSIGQVIKGLITPRTSPQLGPAVPGAPRTHTCTETRAHATATATATATTQHHHHLTVPTGQQASRWTWPTCPCPESAAAYMLAATHLSRRGLAGSGTTRCRSDRAYGPRPRSLSHPGARLSASPLCTGHGRFDGGGFEAVHHSKTDLFIDRAVAVRLTTERAGELFEHARQAANAWGGQNHQHVSCGIQSLASRTATSNINERPC